jgi:hypothetical protein
MSGQRRPIGRWLRLALRKTNGCQKEPARLISSRTTGKTRVAHSTGSRGRPPEQGDEIPVPKLEPQGRRAGKE